MNLSLTNISQYPMKRFAGRSRVIWICVGAAVLSLLAPSFPLGLRADDREKFTSIEKAYAELLGEFPEDRQGYGKDHHLKFTGDQPMTMGLVVSAEAIHMSYAPNDESRRRLQKGVQWLLDNRDLDNDGAPGWGLPQPWDTFADGTENPPNHPYTITTSIVMQGLLDSLKAPSVWSSEEETKIKEVLVEVARRWCSEIWSEGHGGGYFWYSPRPEDGVFGINAASMFLASLSRLVAEQEESLTPQDRELFVRRRDALARAMVSTAELRDGAPYWTYVAQPNRYNNKQLNDLIHHVYTLWGIETYRDVGGPVALPWSRAKAIESVDRFWRDGHPSRYAQDSKGPVKEQPRLWSVGMMLAFYAHWGTKEQSDACFSSFRDRYGPWPHLSLYPTKDENLATCYPRHAAHLLYGLSLYCSQLN